MTKTEKIKQILHDVSCDTEWEVNNVNAGGCAVFALRVGRALEAMGCYVRVAVFGDDERNNIIKARRHVLSGEADWRDNVYFGHVVLDVRIGRYNMFYDSRGLSMRYDKWNSRFPLCKGRMTLDELEVMANDCNYWNRTFNRRTEIPKINRIVDKHFFSQEERRAA